MDKGDEHIINWVLERTDKKRQKNHFNLRKRSGSFEKRKVQIDNQIFLCKSCNHTWSRVPKALDSSGWRLYPKANMPTIGKKREICPNCKEM